MQNALSAASPQAGPSAWLVQDLKPRLPGNRRGTDRCREMGRAAHCAARGCDQPRDALSHGVARRSESSGGKSGFSPSIVQTSAYRTDPHRPSSFNRAIPAAMVQYIRHGCSDSPPMYGGLTCGRHPAANVTAVTLPIPNGVATHQVTQGAQEFPQRKAPPPSCQRALGRSGW
jgi:hypothetical protein